MLTPSRVSSARSPSSRKMKRWVTGSKAQTSEAMKFSPKPSPITKGLPKRAATSRLGSWVSMTPRA